VEKPVIPAQAECTKAAFEAISTELSGLPDNWLTMSDDAQARTLAANKSDDGERYRSVIAKAIRCAPEK
jgi:hypothetical protein